MAGVKRLGNRPRSLEEVGGRALDGEPFDSLVREFLDSFYLAGQVEKRAGLAAAPEPVGAVHDAYLAAVAEHLALRHGLPVPSWTETPDRFLQHPWFAGGLESLKAILLAESPLAFRRRGLFVTRDALSRPRDPVYSSPAPA